MQCTDIGQLRHTYLRVLYPLLNHTQLRHAPHYKRDELLRLLECLSGARSNHFQPVDSTTIRLVSRCATVPWLQPKPENPAHKLLGMSLGHHGESSISVVEVAAQTERPGIHLPHRPTPLHGRMVPAAPAAVAGGEVHTNEAAAGGVEIAGEA